MILEAVASHDLWIWHAYFGLPGSCYDINVLQRSPIFSAYIRGESPPVHFTVNGRTYDMGYYLADGIYPDWPAFVKSVRHPMERKTQRFAAVLQYCHQVTRTWLPAAFWNCTRCNLQHWYSEAYTEPCSRLNCNLTVICSAIPYALVPCFGYVLNIFNISAILQAEGWFSRKYWEEFLSFLKYSQFSEVFLLILQAVSQHITIVTSLCWRASLEIGREQ